MKEQRLRLRADLRDALAQREVRAFSVGPSGEALILAARGAETSGVPRVRALGRPPAPRSWQDQDAVALRHTGASYERALLRDVAVEFPRIQPLPNGGWLVVGSRSTRLPDGARERNARVYSPGGDPVRAFFLGDGIADVQVSSRGEVWASFFDEGVYGNQSTVPSVGSAGLYRFDVEGRKRWEFVPPPGVGDISDCYALNVTPSHAWAYYYTDFPLVRIDEDGAVRAWRPHLRGATAFAVDGRGVLFAGEHGRPWSASLMEFEGARLLHAVDVDLVKPAGDPFRQDARLVGRADELHALEDGLWYSLSLADVPRS